MTNSRLSSLLFSITLLVSVLITLSSFQVAFATSNSQIEVYIPKKITYKIDKANQTIITGSQKIYNNSDSDIRIKGLKITAKDGWRLLDYPFTVSDYADNSQFIAIQINNTNVSSNGVLENLDSDSWKITPDTPFDLGIKLLVSNQTKSIDVNSILNIQYTIEKVETHVHNLSGWKTDDNNHWKECLGCNEKLEIATHSWNAGVITTQPSCTTAGTKTFTCTTCGEQKQTSIAAIGHNYDDGVDEPSNRRLRHTCRNCGNVVYTYYTELTLTSSNRSWVGYTGASNQSLNIPGFFKRGSTTYKVVAIGNECFWNCSDLVSVTVPDTVKTIGERAFSLSKNITTIRLPNGLTEIPKYMCSNCTKLSNIQIPSTVTSIGNYAFDYTAITSITLPSGLKSLGTQAFATSKLTSITVPNGCIMSSSGAFNKCSQLQTIVIGEGTSDFSYAFQNVTGLRYLTLPSTTTTLTNNTFYGCNNIVQVKINRYSGSISGAPWGLSSNKIKWK